MKTVSPNLREVRVSFIRNKTCRKQKAYGYNFYPKYEICAGTMKGGRDACQGDSGGPLVRTIKGVRRQVGIVSWGDGCAKRNKPGIYARVSQLLPWIRSTISE